jgi:hypothetical protein
MRRSLRLALGVVVLAYTAAAASPAAVADHGGAVTVDGTVTGVDGAPATDAVVLLGESATLRELSPDELRRLAAAEPGNLTVVEVDSGGRFEATLESSRAEAAVAVSDAGISELVFVRGDATLDVTLYERRPQTVHEHLGPVIGDERRAELYVNLHNNGETAVENLSVRLESLPDGWEVAGVETDGVYRSDGRTLHWWSVAPGDAVDTTVVLVVPEDAATGEYAVEMRAESDTHRIDADSVTVEVPPAETPGPTTVPPSPGEGTTRPPTATTATPTDGAGPGFGTAATVAGLALLTGLLVGRR